VKALRPYGAAGSLARAVIIMVGLQVLTETAARLVWHALATAAATAVVVVAGRQLVIRQRGWPG
jgi:hypothetical protein